MLVDVRIGRFALDRASAQRLGKIEEKLIPRHATANAETKEVIRATIAWLRIVEKATTEGNHQARSDPQVFRSQAYPGGVVSFTTQNRLSLARGRTVFD